MRKAERGGREGWRERITAQKDTSGGKKRVVEY